MYGAGGTNAFGGLCGAGAFGGLCGASAFGGPEGLGPAPFTTFVAPFNPNFVAAFKMIPGGGDLYKDLFACAWRVTACA